MHGCILPIRLSTIFWRKRELENYFIAPEYLSKSKFLSKCKPNELESRLLKIAASRIYFDIANQTIATIRESQKQNWIEDFKDPGYFTSATAAIDQVKARSELKSRAIDITNQLKSEAIEKIFRQLEREFLDGTNKPELGKGQWLNKMRGKYILKALVAECFRVTDGANRVLTGHEAVNLVAEQLLSLNLTEQPNDFQELHRLISKRVQSRV